MKISLKRKCPYCGSLKIVKYARVGHCFWEYECSNCDNVFRGTKLSKIKIALYN